LLSTDALERDVALARDRVTLTLYCTPEEQCAAQEGLCRAMLVLEQTKKEHAIRQLQADVDTTKAKLAFLDKNVICHVDLYDNDEWSRFRSAGAPQQKGTKSPLGKRKVSSLWRVLWRQDPIVQLDSISRSFGGGGTLEGRSVNKMFALNTCVKIVNNSIKSPIFVDR